ncbi:INSulin related [Caenorhabditis elegans]|uniref:INSulin related n=1 Tax=Caenorhabditis elegans TaxID=6239 RepID=Q2EEL8_CAEEL|nr:INSulin related [Caenorhabditis elegans]CAJ76963.2 INSulin related [Caenorhabditis elegans]
MKLFLCLLLLLALVQQMNCRRLSQPIEVEKELCIDNCKAGETCVNGLGCLSKEEVQMMIDESNKPRTT